MTTVYATVRPSGDSSASPTDRRRLRSLACRPAEAGDCDWTGAAESARTQSEEQSRWTVRTSRLGWRKGEKVRAANIVRGPPIRTTRCVLPGPRWEGAARDAPFAKGAFCPVDWLCGNDCEDGMYAQARCRYGT